MKSDPATILAGQVRAGLDAANWTQADLAEAAGTTRAEVSNILRGKRNPGWQSVCSIAEALGIVISTEG